METNYCAEYVIGAKQHPHTLNAVRFIESAVKFRLPVGGKLIDIKPKSNAILQYKTTFQDYISELKLPFDTVVLEFCCEDIVFVVMAANGFDNSIVFSYRYRARENKIRWYSSKGSIKIKADSFEVSKSLEINEDYGDNDNQVLDRVSVTLLSFVAALQCSNVKMVDETAPIKLNKSRIKKGKQPFFDYKVLTIDTKGKPEQSKSKGCISRTSTRVHLRRGHIRRLEHKTVWVNPCVVGDKSKGMVTKDYRILGDFD